MKQTQNQFYGKKAEMPYKMPPGSTYICSDEDTIYHAREDGVPILFAGSGNSSPNLNNWSTINSAQTLSAGNYIFDMSGGSFTCLLDNTLNKEYELADPNFTSEANPLTIGDGSDTFTDETGTQASGPYIVSRNSFHFKIVCTGNNEYKIIQEAGSSGGADLPVILKTGNTVVFTEDALYNSGNLYGGNNPYLTSGDIIIDGAGALEGATIEQYFDRFVPNITVSNSEKYLISGQTPSNDKLNIYRIWYNGDTYNTLIYTKNYISTPSMTIDFGSTENFITGWQVANATNYIISFNTVDDESTATEIYNGNGTDLSENFVYKHISLTNGQIYYYYIVASGNGYLDSVTGTGNATPLDGFTATFQSPDGFVDFRNILKSTGTYNFQFYVDGVAGDIITLYNQAEANLNLGDTLTHTIELRGIVEGVQFGVGAERNKIYEIQKWGSMKWGIGDNSIVSFFENCDNLDYSATDTPILNTTTLVNAFRRIASSFTINMTSWNFTPITTVQGMFLDSTGINPNVEGLDFSNVQSFRSFLQNTDSWTGTMTNANMASAEDCYQMFRLNNSANPDADTWTNFAPTDVTQFFGGTSFTTKSLANWDITNLTIGNNMLLNKTMSTADYDSTLISWAAQAYNNNVTIHFGNSTYTLGGAAETARGVLVAAGWIITDGGGI